MSEDVLMRIQQLMEVDLVRLLDAIEEADDALLELEAGKRVARPTATPAPARRHGTGAPAPVRRHGTGTPAPARGRHATPGPARQRAISPRRLRQAWEAVRGQLVAHVEREQQLVLPTCKHVVSGMEALRGGLKAPVRQMVAEHRDLSEGVLAVRLEAARVEPVRREFLTVCRLWDEHVQEEESLVFPEALAEITDEVSLITRRPELVQDADHIGANLRLAAARSSAQQEPEAPADKGVVGRLFRFLDRKK